MRWRDLFLLYCLSALVLWGSAYLQTSPGYLDADYYYAGAAQLASGAGLSEPYLWNYLVLPQALPAPAFAYWMPLTSGVAAVGLLLSGQTSFEAAQFMLVLLAALVAPLTAVLAWTLTKQRGAANFAGGLAVFAGFYLPFLTTTDSFGLVMLLGAGCLLLWANLIEAPARRGAGWLWLASGALAGLQHLARADGLLWLAGGFLAAGLVALRSKPVWRGLLAGGAVLAGYLIVMLPWMGRNLATFGSLLSPGGLRAAFVLTYDELYAFPAEMLTFERWSQAGFSTLLAHRLDALGTNLQSALAVQGLIFLLPLILAGAWLMRRRAAVLLGGSIWGMVFLAMTVIFPFVGARGGYFHAGAALQPLWWALAPVGLQAVLSWGAAKRGWNLAQATPVFHSGLLALAIFVSIVVGWGRLIGEDWEAGEPFRWNRSAAHYAAVETLLQTQAAAPGELVMVNNPPGYFLASGRPAIAIPYGTVETLLAAAERYAAQYVILEQNYANTPLGGLLENPQAAPGLAYLTSLGTTHLFRVVGRAPGD